MNNIQKYFAGREQFIELLEAVGIRTLEQFASADPSTVLPELHQAKRMLKLQTEIPSAATEDMRRNLSVLISAVIKAIVLKKMDIQIVFT